MEEKIKKEDDSEKDALEFFDEKEEEQVKERLKALGYLE